ncbi:hypothetical protein NPIL_271781 [Nephila pilipes]|uniref:Uncharacterized protein n=1 Tax=Nephila pilipes TaxID=299642 RepID=A0A8X6NF63_NEPPI|nr:hypothetical protein NPIL_271781 [Nephila pilipes]
MLLAPLALLNLTPLHLMECSQASFVDINLAYKLKLNVINSSSFLEFKLLNLLTQEQRRCDQLTFSGSGVLLDFDHSLKATTVRQAHPGAKH